MPHTVDWEDRWAVFFGKLLRGVCKFDLETNGPWPEMERATEQVITKVVPRLLGNLKHEGKPIEPCILHGDLWEPNLGINMETGDLVMYDVGLYYGHNEMDLGQWRADFCSHLRSKIYTRHYLRNYPPAEPVEEFDDRNRLYSMKSTINYSAGHPGCIVRQT
jgi:fructosamine-3-kinase